MANQFEVLSFITNEFLRQVSNNLQFVRNCRGEDIGAHFTSTPKKGESIKVRKPTRYIGATGETYTPEDHIDQFCTMTVQPTEQVGVTLTNRELLFKFDRLAEDVVKPAAETMANNIDRKALAMAIQATPNSVGTPGTIPNTVKTYNQARAKMVWEGCPQDTRHTLLISPDMQVEGVESGRPIFNPNSDISKQHRTGMLAPFYGAEVFECQNLLTHQVGPLGGTPLVNGAGQTGTSLVTDGWTAAAALRLRAGDVFTIAGVQAVNPWTRQTTGALRQFVVTSNVTSDASGNATIPFVGTDDRGIVTTGPFQNVTASPADNAVITIVGTTNAFIPQGLRFHREAFLFDTFKQPSPGSAVTFTKEVTDEDTGITIRFIQDWDTKANEQINRFDCVWAFGVAYRQWACRIQSGVPA